MAGPSDSTFAQRVSPNRLHIVKPKTLLQAACFGRSGGMTRLSENGLDLDAAKDGSQDTVLGEVPLFDPFDSCCERSENWVCETLIPTTRSSRVSQAL